ncbi:hypothetical protein BJX68DRAFT_274327 [Aspergillus pseudodeflectus]|uniref:L-ornithine N(5)-monooxygenase n=1 Tax=Aspergillus pseudodeflectus TaxID=176178 RepID=A0ABR4JBB0_9EURO
MSMLLDSSFLEVVIVGAGLGGICAAVNLQKQYPHATFGVFEKHHRIGGTWAKNIYPGLRCDIPSVLYSYSFAPNPNWSSTYASQPEILAYIDGVATGHHLPERIRLQQECLSATWKEDDHTWEVHFKDAASGTLYTVYCRSLITSVGFLDVPRGPDGIVGFTKFQGRVFHSASWDHSVDFEGRNVVVIGNGCSANQFIPWLVKQTGLSKLTQVIRSPHWIAPKTDRIIGSKEKWLLSHIPWFLKTRRWLLATKFDLAFAAFRKTTLGRFLRTHLEVNLKRYMQRAAPAKYHSLLIPAFTFGAKRPVLDHGYLGVLHDSRVGLRLSENLRVSGPYSLAADGGQEIPAEILILANGFKSQSLITPIKILGRDGVTISDVWHKDGSYPSAYMGVTAPSFPNFFMITGPNTLPSGHSTLLGIECSVEYIMRVLQPLFSHNKRDRCRWIDVRPAAHEMYNVNLQHKLDGLIYSADVQNWYVDARTGRNTLVWPGTQTEFWLTRCVWPVRWEDYAVGY